MNINQYKLLCNTCDSVLNKNRNLYRISIPWLHVIREHPVSLKQYKSLFISNSNNISSSEKSLSVKKLYKRILSIFFLNGSPLLNSIKYRDVDAIFVSHLLNTDHLNLDDDFYFSDIHNFLKNNNINSLFILINHTNENTEILSKQINKSGTPRIILANNLGLKVEVQNIFGLIKEMIKMRAASYKEEGLLKQVLIRSSSINGISGALSALRIGRQVEYIIKLCRPKVIMTTYEGHSWERVVYVTANKCDENLLRIGYQHSVVTKMAHSISRSLGKEYDPDLIFSSGEITHNFLQKSQIGSHSKLLVLGSNKSIDKLDVVDCKETNTCLVLPEGVIEECDMLFRFSIECANALPEVDFIWRLHPVISFNKVLEYMSINAEDLPRNIIISSSSLIDDVGKSTYALYRGTTAIIEAVYGRLMPIYLSDESGLTVDILHEIGDDRKIVSSVQGFKKVVEDTTPHNSAKLINYCKRYFLPFDYSTLLKELKLTI